MKLKELLNNLDRDIKIEVTISDLIEFANYIIEHFERSESENDDEIGGIDLAMKITGLSKSTIYNKVSNNEIPYIKKGRLYFKRSDLIKWIEESNI